MKRELIVQQDPKSPISEVFRTLRTNIQFMNTKGKLKTILVTSTLPGEGKSWVSSNLAVTFAQAGKKVVLIDADMRKGRQYSIFEVSPRPGLSNYLSGIDESNDENHEINLVDYIQETDVENLYLIAAGNIPPNPAELLIAPQMVDLLEQLKEMSDIIIIDGTPSQLVTDALILTRLVDSTLIVTASNQTKKEDLKRIIANIEQVGGKIAGVVVNKILINAKKYEQSYYYGSTTMSRSKGNNKTGQRSMSRTTSKRPNREMYNRASNLMAQSSRTSNNEIGQKNISEEKNLENNVQNEMPKSLQSRINVETKEEISIEKTQEILDQINQYLDEEKKKMN
ncbi:MAG: polysaccharide biosynthesis tyrosine autokinase [Clostridiales bacterium]|nr:polysaccharide biosynthesis tyrosine autokinase [Clostridiales bacterium]